MNKRSKIENYLQHIELELKNLREFKGAVTYMRYFATSKFSRSLVQKKNFSLIWQVVFQLGYVFCQER